jgi:hypothetical protein
MKRFIAIAVLLSLLVVPCFCKTHKEMYQVSCSVLWSAVKDTLRNSGKYGIIAISDSELTASYNIGGTLTGKRVNSVMLNENSEGCEMQVQTAYSGIGNNDVGDFKKRVDDSLAKLQKQPVPAKRPEGAPPAD